MKMKTMVLFVISFGLVCFSSVVAGAGELEPLFPGYPAVFDVRGEVDALNETMAVIDDSAYGLSSSINFNSSQGKISINDIPLDSKVGGVFDHEGRLVSIWLIKAGIQRTGRDTRAIKLQQNKKTGRGKIYKEDGVWKN